jgi:hypothetical protein
MPETFPIIPGQIRVVWIAVPIILTVIVAIAALIYSLVGARTARFEVSSDGLRLRGDFYGRLIPMRDLQLDMARVVDLRNESSLAPVRRTMGTALPGYRAGWFRLRDSERALLYITDPSRVAYVPTHDGYAIMLSVADPEAFLESLRRFGPNR